MGSGGSGVGSNQGVGSNLVPSQGTGSSTNQGTSGYAGQSLAQSATPGTTLNSLPPSFGQPFNTTTTGGAAGSGATGLAPGQTGNVNLAPWGQSQTPTPYSGTPAGVMSQNNGFTGGGSTQYGIPTGSQYVGSTPPSLDLSTPNWSGPPLNQVIYQGNAYNVPPGYTQSQFGTGPGQLNPMTLPPWAASEVSGSTNPPIGNYNPSASINPPKPEAPATGINAPINTRALSDQYNAQMQAANNASTSAYYAYNPDAYPGSGANGDPNTPDTMAQAQAWAAQSPANTAQAAQWQTQSAQDAAARAALPSIGYPGATGQTSSPPGTIAGR